jgi:hypothetical protein
MTTPAFVSEAAVRELITLNGASASAYSSDLIGSNIRAASWFLERATERIFRDEPSLTLKFTTNNADTVYLPGLRTASSLTLNGAAFTADSSYWLVPDVQQTGLSLAVSFHPFGGQDYRSNPEWFDRNLDSPKWQSLQQSHRSLPNDLVISGAWGYADADLPEPVRDTAKRLAAWYTLRSDALLSGAQSTEAGIFDLSHLPTEVQLFVSSWKSGPQVVGL